jgi:hypothetical protein
MQNGLARYISQIAEDEVEDVYGQSYRVFDNYSYTIFNVPEKRFW